MHKQFQKFGFFVSKHVNDEPPKVEDKYIKYLYKKESVDRARKKIKSANEAEKRKEDRHSEKKPNDSAGRKLTRSSNVSDTELFFISPEDIKRHRRKKEKEKATEKPEKRKAVTKTEADVIKFIKQQREKEDGYERLTKKDIFKLINKTRDPKQSTPSSNFLKKFFHFEEFAPLDNKHMKSQSGDSGTKKKTHKEQPINVMYSRELKKKQDKTPIVRKHHEEIPKKKLPCEIVPKPQEKEQKKSRNEDAIKAKQKDLEERMKNVSRANPNRHKKCLVKNTFSIVKIASSVLPTDDSLEKKKKLKAFKKYYKYGRTTDRDSDFTTSTTCHTFSDSHKMYQSVDSVEDMKKQHRKKSTQKNEDYEKYHRKRAERKSKLKLETHVSSVVIMPTAPNKEERSKSSKKSRIPIPNSKIVELARDTSPMSKSRRKSAELFSPNQENKKKNKQLRSPPISEKSVVTQSPKPQKEKIKVDSKESRVSKASTLSKPTKKEKEKPSKPPQSPPRTYRKSGIKSASIDGTSSVWSKSTKKSNKTSLGSKSDTRISSGKKVPEQKFKASGSSAKTSRSNSTCGDKSVDSKTGTSFFLTKSYKDDDKLNRWNKRKEYADNVRKNAISKGHKSVVPRQVLEVRYLTTVTKNEDASKLPKLVETQKNKEFFEDDLPNPCLKLVEDQKFKELFELPTDQALNEILNENYHFLKKDFSFNVEDLPKTPEDLSSIEDESHRDWFSFKTSDPLSLSEISCYRPNSSLNNHELNLGSRDQIVDSLSAPGSEESGYSTIKSRTVSRSFFERPIIKTLLQPPSETFVQIKSSSSFCGLELRSIESKSLQTCTIDCSQKSVQIKLSQEGIFEMIGFSDESGKEDAEKKKEQAVEIKEEEPRLETEQGDKVQGNKDLEVETEQGDKMLENENLEVQKLNKLEKMKRKLFFLSCSCFSSQ